MDRKSSSRRSLPRELRGDENTDFDKLTVEEEAAWDAERDRMEAFLGRELRPLEISTLALRVLDAHRRRVGGQA